MAIKKTTDFFLYRTLVSILEGPEEEDSGEENIQELNWVSSMRTRTVTVLFSIVNSSTLDSAWKVGIV